MPELLRFEFRRLSKSIFYRIVGVYCIVWPVIVVLLLRLILGLFMKDSGLNFADIGLDKGEIRYLNWLISVGFINDLPKFLALFICLHVGRDFTDGIVRNKITAGHSRTSIFFSYLITQIAATVILCAVYIGSALVALLITGFGVDLNGGEMFSRWGTAIVILLVLTVFFTVISLIFRRRALPIVFSIIIVVVMSSLSSIVGAFNLPAKAVNDYIAARDEAYDEMVEENIYTDDYVKTLKKTYTKDTYTNIAWKFCHPAYVVSNLGFNGDYGADATQLIGGNTEYLDELDFSGNFIGYYDGDYSPDGSGLTLRDLKKMDSMRISYTKLNLIYIGRSLLYILVIGGSGYYIFRKKNLF